MRYKSGCFFVYRGQLSFETKSKSEKLKHCVTVINTEEDVPSSEAVASTDTGGMTINYSRLPHPEAQKCWSVIVTSHLRFLITYFSLQTSSFDDPFHTVELLDENWLYFTNFFFFYRSKFTVWRLSSITCTFDPEGFLQA